MFTLPLGVPHLQLCNIQDTMSTATLLFEKYICCFYIQSSSQKCDIIKKYIYIKKHNHQKVIRTQTTKGKAPKHAVLIKKLTTLGMLRGIKIAQSIGLSSNGPLK